MEMKATRKLALLKFSVVDMAGPSEEVMIAILQVFRDAFEYAVEDGWTYKKRLEFCLAFPFEDLVTVEDVEALRSTLFGCPAFAGCAQKIPEAE